MIITFLNDKESFHEILSLPKAHIQNSLENSKTLNKLISTSMELDAVINGKM